MLLLKYKMAKHKGYTRHKAGRGARAVKNLSPRSKEKPTLKASLLHLRNAHLLPVGQGAKPQAYGVLRTFVLGQFPAPNPVEHFFEVGKPRKKPPHKTKAHRLQKNGKPIIECLTIVNGIIT